MATKNSTEILKFLVDVFCNFTLYSLEEVTEVSVVSLITVND